MSLLTIIINVDADRTTTDPHSVAEALGLDITQEIGYWEVEGQQVEINFVGAEWTP